MKKLISSILLLLIVLPSFAQTLELPKKVEAWMPQSLLSSKVVYESTANALISSGNYGQDKNLKPKDKEGKYWVVFSDRSNNITYTTPGGSTQFATLDFNEELRIAKIQGEYALVYDEPVPNVIYPQVSASAKVRGWVKMANLLLWDSCLTDERGIYYKSLLCINADESTAKNYGIGYTNPDDQSSQMYLTTDMKFYFIMKRTKDGKVLLATQHNMNDGLSSKVLYSWVPSESFVPWNQRSCIEPTWEHEDVEYFADKGIIAKIYDSKSLSGSEASRVPYTRSNAGYSQYQYRMRPEALRFPILDGTDDTKWECSSFTSSKGSINVRQEENPLVVKQKAELNKLKQFNLAIVIDGTKSMDPYFPAVARAIQEGCAFFDKEKYDIKVGVLIYRDYLDGDGGLYEMIPFTKPTDPNLFSFLQTGGKYGIRSSDKDRSYVEALFTGLDTALEKFNFNNSQSNLMLVIGDCGNAENDPQAPTEEQIVKKIVDKNVNLVGFQVRNFDSEAWNLFNRQLLSIMKTSLQQKYDALALGTKVKSKVASDGQVFANDKVSDALYLGAHKYAAQGDEISPAILVDLMKNTMLDYSSLVQHQIDLVATADINTLKKTNDGKKTNFSGSSATLAATTVEINTDWLRKRLGDAFDSSTNQLVGFRGYTSKVDGSGRDFFKTVLFISSEEFDELMTRLKPVDDVAKVTTSDNRKPYIDAVKALLKSMAPGITNAEMDSKGLDEVMNMIEGLNATSSSLENSTSRVTLLQIGDEQAVKPAEYRRIVNEFSRKYQNLSRIKDSRYEFIRDFNGAKYYWIPIEDLP